MAPPKAKGRAAPRKPAPGKRLIVRYPEDMPRRLIARPQYRRIFKDRGPQWLVLEPNRLGLAAGAMFSALALVGYGLAGVIGGAPYPVGQQVVGAMATFVVGYAAVGIFVWYLLYVAEREFGPEIEPEKKSLSLVDLAAEQRRDAAAAGAQAAREAMPAAPEMEPQPEETE